METARILIPGSTEKGINPLLTARSQEQVMALKEALGFNPNQTCVYTGLCAYQDQMAKILKLEIDGYYDEYGNGDNLLTGADGKQTVLCLDGSEVTLDKYPLPSPDEISRLLVHTACDNDLILGSHNLLRSLGKEIPSKTSLWQIDFDIELPPKLTRIAWHHPLFFDLI